VPRGENEIDPAFVITIPSGSGLVVTPCLALDHAVLRDQMRQLKAVFTETARILIPCSSVACRTGPSS
jgi:hypothetical protein